jgi:hypothetical protein
MASLGRIVADEWKDTHQQITLLPAMAHLISLSDYPDLFQVSIHNHPNTTILQIRFVEDLDYIVAASEDGNICKFILLGHSCITYTECPESFSLHHHVLSWGRGVGADAPQASPKNMFFMPSSPDKKLATALDPMSQTRPTAKLWRTKTTRLSWSRLSTL